MNYPWKITITLTASDYDNLKTGLQSALTNAIHAKSWQALQMVAGSTSGDRGWSITMNATGPLEVQLEELKKQIAEIENRLKGDAK